MICGGRWRYQLGQSLLQWQSWWKHYRLRWCYNNLVSLTFWWRCNVYFSWDFTSLFHCPCSWVLWCNGEKTIEPPNTLLVRYKVIILLVRCRLDQIMIINRLCGRLNVCKRVNGFLMLLIDSIIINYFNNIQVVFFTSWLLALNRIMTLFILIGDDLDLIIDDSLAFLIK